MIATALLSRRWRWWSMAILIEKDPNVSAQQQNVQWIRADGKPMEPVDWEHGGWMRASVMFLKGDAPEIRDREGRHITDDDFVLLLNAHSEEVEFRLPQDLATWDWKIAIDTTRPELQLDNEAVQKAGIKLGSRPSVVLVHERSLKK